MRKKMNLKMLCKRYSNGGGEPPAQPIPELQPKSEPQPDPAEPPRTFTQEEVNRMMAKEKNEGRKSVLKELGIENIDDAKNNLSAYNKLKESQMTELEKATEAQKRLEGEKAAAQKAQEIAEGKLKLLTEGCNKENLDEALVLVMSKVSDATDFDAALKQVKEKIPSMFTDDNPQGTGSPVGHKRNPGTDKPGTMGARLAGRNKPDPNKSKPNPYFSR